MFIVTMMVAFGFYTEYFTTGLLRIVCDSDVPMRNNPEEHRSHLQHSRSLKSLTVRLYVAYSDVSQNVLLTSAG